MQTACNLHTLCTIIEVITCGAGAGQGQEKSWGDRAGPPVRVRQAGGWPPVAGRLGFPRGGKVGTSRAGPGSEV